MTARVISVNLSDRKGVGKHPVPRGAIDEKGIVGDAHAGPGLRQVSLIGTQSLETFGAEAGRQIGYGELAENLTVEGLPFASLSLLDTLRIGDVVLEITQIGKKCHGSGCSIFRELGKCIMPKEGIFCRVQNGGIVAPGDAIAHTPRALKLAIITLSDRAARGEYEDLSGPAVAAAAASYFGDAERLEIAQTILADDGPLLSAQVSRYVNEGVDVLITTGGTGIGPRDIAPDILRPLLDKEMPGIMEFIRTKYGASFPQALTSRSIAGTIGKTQVYALPGSKKAVNEYMAEILKVVEHNRRMLHGLDAH